ncbi:MAG TPA: 3-oxoacyl-ACP reductase FabG [Candidatus Limnocylindria bacterium]|nr:3-oxoacyl-ACP reductase FabG [Candidatus Limnocylindria bacterium]
MARQGRDLEGAVALVTGGSRGIGRAISVALARHGCDVAFTYRSDDEGAKKTAHEIEATGKCALGLKADGRDPAAPGKAVMDAVGRFGRLDILVNNAGLNRDGVVWKMTDEEWNEVIDADLGAAFRFTRAVVPIFREAGSGRIVNISSINGLRGKFGQSNYAAAKAGLIGFTKSVARELGSFNVTANVVAPGLIETDMVRTMPEEAKQKSLSEIVLGRLGTPEDVAAAVTFLAGPAAQHITGVVLQVDGGQYL